MLPAWLHSVTLPLQNTRISPVHNFRIGSGLMKEVPSPWIGSNVAPSTTCCLGQALKCPTLPSMNSSHNSPRNTFHQFLWAALHQLRVMHMYLDLTAPLHSLISKFVPMAFASAGFASFLASRLWNCLSSAGICSRNRLPDPTSDILRQILWRKTQKTHLSSNPHISGEVDRFSR